MKVDLFHLKISSRLLKLNYDRLRTKIAHRCIIRDLSFVTKRGIISCRMLSTCQFKEEDSWQVRFSISKVMKLARLYVNQLTSLYKITSCLWFVNGTSPFSQAMATLFHCAVCDVIRQWRHNTLFMPFVEKNACSYKRIIFRPASNEDTEN